MRQRRLRNVENQGFRRHDFRAPREEISADSNGDVVDSNGNIHVIGGTLGLSAPPWPDYEGSLLCSGDVTISGGNIASVGCMGVNVYREGQPILWVSHVDELPEGTVLSLRDDKGAVIIEFTTRSAAVQSAYTSSELKAGSEYVLYIDGKKKPEVTPGSGMNAIGDDGGKFTVVCRGNFLRAREPFGAVVKKSELLQVNE